MKKYLIAFATSLIFVFFTTTLSAQSTKGDNMLIAKARQAASSCITPFLSQGLSVDGQIETTGICFVSGELRKVTFYATVKCTHAPCPKPAATYVATVYFDCSNNVTLVECAK